MAADIVTNILNTIRDIAITALKTPFIIWQKVPLPIKYMLSGFILLACGSIVFYIYYRWSDIKIHLY